jgi:hypothetical protein
MKLERFILCSQEPHKLNLTIAICCSRLFIMLLWNGVEESNFIILTNRKFFKLNIKLYIARVKRFQI